jgi:hypothetical protein
LKEKMGHATAAIPIMITMDEISSEHPRNAKTQNITSESGCRSGFDSTVDEAFDAS